MTGPPEVTQLLDQLLAGVSQALGGNLLGVYLCGSLALGGFDRASSDVDVLVVTERPVTDAEFAVLGALHRRLPPTGNDFALEYEVYYIDRATVRRFAPGQRHVKVGTDEALQWMQHRPNWVLERWTVRERGVTMVGPDPKTLIEPVSPAEMRKAAYDELRERLQHWGDGSWPRTELLHRGAQGYEVETTCRALFTIETGALHSKREAIDWALRKLPQEWRPLLEWSQQIRKDRTPDDARIDEVLRFLQWAVASANETP